MCRRGSHVCVPDCFFANAGLVDLSDCLDHCVDARNCDCVSAVDDSGHNHHVHPASYCAWSGSRDLCPACGHDHDPCCAIAFFVCLRRRNCATCCGASGNPCRVPGHDLGRRDRPAGDCRGPYCLCPCKVEKRLLCAK